MVTTQFLENSVLWNEIHRCAKSSKIVRAAFAYFGSFGSKLLPLKKGDILLVDMSEKAVKHGNTDPKEIDKLRKKGVVVFSRPSLHAKFIFSNRLLIACSANISNNSKDNLDEAGIKTSDFNDIRRANTFFKSLCTEPIRTEYLKYCIKIYRPPKFGKNNKGKRKIKRIQELKLWFINGLTYYDISDLEKPIVNKIKVKTKNTHNVSTVDYTHYPVEMDYFHSLKKGDWVVECISDDKRKKYVGAPMQFLEIKNYPIGKGKRRYLLLYEVSTNPERILFSSFRKRIGKTVPQLNLSNPHTKPIYDRTCADAILRIWTQTGRISNKR